MKNASIWMTSTFLLATVGNSAIAADPVQTGKQPFMVDTKTGRKIYASKTVEHHPMVSRPANSQPASGAPVPKKASARLD